MLTRIKNEERGIALIVSMMVVFVVLILGTVVVAQSISNQGQSSYNRKRLQSVAAAEAGIDWFYNYVSHTRATNLVCTDQTQQVADAPGGAARFTATPVFYNASGATMNCPFSNSSYPRAVLVTSRGTVAGGARRTMQTYMRLKPVFAGFEAAVVVNGAGGLTLGNNLTLNGNGSNNADIFVNEGPLVITNAPAVYGSVYVGGACPTPSTCTTSMSNGARIVNNLYSAGSVTISNPAQVNGNVISAVGSISGSGSIGGNATAAGTISASTNVAGTRSPNTSSPLPPTQEFPHIDWVESDWQNPPDGTTGYTVVPFSGATACTAAEAWMSTAGNLGAAVTTNIVVRIAANCTLTFNSLDKITFGGNLAIFTDGAITMSQHPVWTGSGGQRKLFFIDQWRDGLNCSADANLDGVKDYDISDSQLVEYESVDVFMYSPCKVTINNRSVMSGQVFGGTVDVKNQISLDFRPVLVPGKGVVTGFDQDIVYVREVR